MGTIDYRVLDGKTGSWYKGNSFWADRKVLVHPKAGIVPRHLNAASRAAMPFTLGLIRREADYAALDLNSRKKLFRAQFSFIRHAPIGFKTFLFHKKEFQGDHDALVSRMSRDISSFIKENLAFFQSFERVIGSPRDLRKNYLKPLSKMSSLPGTR